MAIKNKNNQTLLDAGTIAVNTKQYQLVWRQFKKNKGAMIGLILFAIVIIIMIFAGILLDYDTHILDMNSSRRFMKPSLESLELLFGTDHMGRSVFYRVCYGARYSMIIGFGAVAISAIFGIGFGAIAGYFGGIVDTIVMRVVELFMMIPNMLLTIVFVSVFGINLRNLIIAFGVSTIPTFARNARASVMTVCGNEYVEAARALGVGHGTIILTHILPNCLSPILVQATTRLGSCIVGAAGFSFLGLGVPIPTPEWGAMLADARAYMYNAPYLLFFPGLAIFITVLAVNLIGDGLRDAFDPKLKR